MSTVEAELLPPETKQAVAVREPAKPEPSSSQQLRTVEVSQALEPAYAKASQLELTDAEIAALTEPFPDSAVEIRPHDGLIYIPHIEISNRLNKVLKPGKWALVCRRHWLENSVMYGEHVLLIRGCFVGESVGGHPYVASNPKTNYSDSLESTAAEALRRICGKRLSCGSQVWVPEYARQWVAKYGVQERGKWYKRTNPSGQSQPADPQPDPEDDNVSFETLPPAKTPQDAPAANTTSVKPKSSAPAKPAPAAGAIEATEEQKAKLIAQLEAEPEGRLKATLYYIEIGAILPTEKLEDVGLRFIPRTVSQMRELGLRIETLANHGRAEKCVWFFDHLGAAPKASGTSAAPTATDTRVSGATKGAAPSQPKPKDPEWWRDVIITVPRKGMSRDAYLRDPDTIGSLYDMRHGNDEDAQAARQRLYGMVHSWEPKPWKKRSGEEVPPSAADVNCRAALDAFWQFWEQNHPDEKF